MPEVIQYIACVYQDFDVNKTLLFLTIKDCVLELSKQVQILEFEH